MDDVKKRSKSNPVVLSDNLFPVVGIGASAGGLNAFRTLITAIPEDSGMAFVLVQHLDPNHESLLPELLQKATPIKVLEISDDIKVRPNHIYILPSNKMLTANDGVLELSLRPDRSTNKPNLPIDLFFDSLATIHKAHAIGVVLSGTGSDGSKGLQAIKAQGGLTFAQDQDSSAFKQMPANAISMGVVDYILSPDQIPQKILELRNHFQPLEQPEKTEITEDEGYNQIISFLRVWKGTDFSSYKQSTIRRRISRRMAINKAEDFGSYIWFLQQNKTEQDALFQDLLIPVTTFFRDQNVFDHLIEKVFPELIQKQKDGLPIRVWVAGCSTGQEAYSLAISLRQLLGPHVHQVQIFASDLSAPAIEKARKGFFTTKEITEVDDQILHEYFTKQAGGYQIKKEIRDMCIFAVHNFLKDPPFGRMDLISCRNVLIYLESHLQKKALSTFHYALGPNGYLLLGKSESSAVATGLFKSTNKAFKLFARKEVANKSIPFTTTSSQETFTGYSSLKDPKKVKPDFQSAADEMILTKYAPAGVVINQTMEIVQFRGDTSGYLQQASGEPSHNLLKMAKNELAFELRNLFHKVKKQGIPISKENFPVQVDEGMRLLSIEVIPLTNLAEPHFLVLFKLPVKSLALETGKKGARLSTQQKKDEKDLRIKQLEREMVETYQDIQIITETQEMAYKELQAANEDLLSGSEELQSLNEELQASREELLSTNEELTVLNHQLISVNRQLVTSRNYAEAIVGTIREPLLMLDSKFRIKTANSAFFKTFQISRPRIVGTSLFELENGQWDIPLLHTLLKVNLPSKTEITDVEISHDFPGIGNRVLLMSVCDISTEGQEEKFILLAIEDITQQKQHQIANKLFEKQLEDQVAQRTFELLEANKLLVLKNEELEKMNREVESFSYVASHDLQEPLRKIQAFAGRILKNEHEALSETGKDYFHRMQLAANRMQILIEDLLAYSHSSSKDHTFESTDLDQIVIEVIAELKESLQAKNAEIQFTALGFAWIKPFQFRQVITNLLGNSLKFSKADVPPEITIKSDKQTGLHFQRTNALLDHGALVPDKQYTHLSFCDNGIGFDPQYKDRIFVVFQRLNGKESYAGTGIGLAIVKKIIDSHHGTITAKGESGVGAQFDIYLPVNE
ncbi:CheR family methyltransferase [Arundinibacter roseus]|uniref:PAS domain-containing protein n=1 Tax=Arundinibacter roseus TaxID=2070510 RepID=A0A4R4KHA4_9BACT|nr:chemotaxis protein CheB [Arundinibacter roseus]TDB67464.1 PAS domain-containing protein [Arundinibacter roseus]